MPAVMITNSKRKAKEILEKNDAQETNKDSDMSAGKMTNRRIKQSSEKSNRKTLEHTTGKELVITSTEMKGAQFVYFIIFSPWECAVIIILYPFFTSMP